MPDVRISDRFWAPWVKRVTAPVTGSRSTRSQKAPARAAQRPRIGAAAGEAIASLIVRSYQSAVSVRPGMALGWKAKPALKVSAVSGSSWVLPEVTPGMRPFRLKLAWL